MWRGPFNTWMAHVFERISISQTLCPLMGPAVFHICCRVSHFICSEFESSSRPLIKYQIKRQSVKWISIYTSDTSPKKCAVVWVQNLSPPLIPLHFYCSRRTIKQRLTELIQVINLIITVLRKLYWMWIVSEGIWLSLQNAYYLKNSTWVGHVFTDIKFPWTPGKKLLLLSLANMKHISWKVHDHFTRCFWEASHTKLFRFKFVFRISKNTKH